MSRFSEQFYKKSESVKLTHTEREALRQRMVSFMEYHPLPATMKQASAKVIPTPFFNDGYTGIRIPLSMLLKWSAAVSALVLIVVPVLAEKAVPGDTLYAIKVRFNEEVRSTLTLSTYEKVEWETERLNRRLAEARLLADEGRLTSEVEAEVAAAVREHTESAQEGIETLRESDADEATLASIELNTTLELQSTTLQGDATVLAMNVDIAQSEDSSTQLLADVLSESLSKQGESDVASSTVSFEKIAARVEVNTTRAHELLSSINIETGDNLKIGINRRIDDINRLIERAHSTRTQSEEAGRQHLLNALQRSQKLIVYLNDVRVGRSMDLETVVPTIPTPDEEHTIIESSTTDIKQKIQLLSEAEPRLAPNLAEKIAYTLTLVSEKQAAIETTSEFTEKKRLIDEALSLLNDALSLVETESDALTPIDPVEPATPVTPATSTTPARR